MSLNASLADLPKTRLALLPNWAAAFILVVLAALIGFGLVPTAKPLDSHVGISSNDQDTDLELYKAISRRVAAGQTYYAAATAEHRARGYPLRPFVTVRLPTVAMIHAKLGTVLATALLWSLTLAALTRSIFRLRADLGSGRHTLYGSALAAVALGPMLAPSCAYWHEPWAAALIALSLACRSRERWALSVLFGLAAVAVRELALPYLCVMAVAAAFESCRREAAAWVGAILVAAGLLTAHAFILSGYVTAADLHSPGWDSFGGWRFILQMAHNFTSLSILPAPFVALVVPLALLGWATWRGPFGLRGALLLGGYICAFMVVGRPDNDYWGMMIAPLLPIGLVFVPAALRDLVVAGRQGLFTDDRRKAIA